MSAVNDPELQSLRHLHALRNFIGNLVEQAEKSGGCECHKPPSLLLVGPPGAGKTYLVKQMSKVCEMPLFGVHTHQVANAASIKKLFLQARENYPSLVFLDDVDSIFADHEEDTTCSSHVQEIREEIFTELGPRKLKIHDPETSHNPTQQTMHSSPGSSSSRASSRSSSMSRPRPSAPELNDSYDESLYPDNNGIIVVAATSAPWLLYKDHELLSRFRGVYLVGLPDRDSRFNLLKSLMMELHHTLTEEQIGEVADKTKGFTPADLMVVMKTLSYRQFSFLLNVANDREGGSQGNSTSASPTPTSSDLTETGSDTDIDGLSEPKNKARLAENGASGGAIAAAATIAAASLAAAHVNKQKDKRGVSPAANSEGGAVGGVGPKDQGPTTTTTVVNGEGLMSRAAAAGIAVTAVGAAAATVAALNHDWTSDSEEESGRITQRERIPSGVLSVSPDSGMILSRSSEEAIPRLDQPDSGRQTNASDAQDSPRLDDELQQSDSHDRIHQHEHTELKHNDTLQSNANRSSASVDDSEKNIPNIDIDNISNHSVEEHGKQNTDDSINNEVFTSENNTNPHKSLQATSNEDINDTSHNEFLNMSSASHKSSSPEPDSYYENNVHDYKPENIHNEDGIDATGCSETEEIVVHPEYKNAPSPSAPASSPQENIEESISPPEQFAENADSSVDCRDMQEFNSNDDRSVEIHYSEPPDPMRDDNLAVDSDSDNESPMMRPRRVGFSSRPAAIDPMSGGGYNNRSPALNALSVDCGSDDGPPNISMDTLSSSAALNNGGSDNILRQLLSRPSHTNNNGGSPGRQSSPSPGCSPTPPASPAPSNCSSGAATLASSGSGRGSPHHLMQQDLHHTPLHQTEDHHQQQRSGTQRPRQQSPLRQMDDRQSPLHHSPHHSSPHHSSHHNSPHHSSQHHNSPHHTSQHQNSPHHQESPHPHNRENGNVKDDSRKQMPLHDADDENSVGVKAVTGLGAAAAAATVAPSVVNGVTEDDMAKLIDALELHMDGDRGMSVRKGSDGEASEESEDETTTDDDDEDDVDGDKVAIAAIDEINTVGIQPITLGDVLDVIAKGYRSVSEEEINKYTEFMVWFANVAKSACPHNNGNRSECPTLDEDEDEYGVESTLCATPNLLKRNQRRKPLKKLGKFLLKALMFILD